METAAASSDGFLTLAPESRRPIEKAAMENREFNYDALVRPLEGRMMRTIWRIVRQREAAEDALQDALAVIWKKRDAVARHPNPRALILRIVIAAAYDAVRKSRRRLLHEIPNAPREPADEAVPMAVREYEEQRLRAAILAAVGRLPKRQATAFLMHVVEEQSYEEISRAMECSETTVRVQVMRARAKVARRLADLYPSLARVGDGARKEAVP